MRTNDDDLVGKITLARKHRTDVFCHDGCALGLAGEGQGSIELEHAKALVGELDDLVDRALAGIARFEELGAGLWAHEEDRHGGRAAAAAAKAGELADAGVVGAGGVDKDDGLSAAVDGAADLASQAGLSGPAAAAGPLAVALFIHGLKAEHDRDLARQIIVLIKAGPAIGAVLDGVAHEHRLRSAGLVGAKACEDEVLLGLEAHGIVADHGHEALALDFPLPAQGEGIAE